MHLSWLRKLAETWFAKPRGQQARRRPDRSRKPGVGLRLEWLEDRLAPATFSNGGGTLNLNDFIAGASMDVSKTGPNQIQVVLGAAGDLWQGTDDPTAGIVGNGTATLTINTSLNTNSLGISSGSNNTGQLGLLTIHGGGNNGRLSDHRRLLGRHRLDRRQHPHHRRLPGHRRAFPNHGHRRPDHRRADYEHLDAHVYGQYHYRQCPDSDGLGHQCRTAPECGVHRQHQFDCHRRYHPERRANHRQCRQSGPAGGERSWFRRNHPQGRDRRR